FGGSHSGQGSGSSARRAGSDTSVSARSFGGSHSGQGSGSSARRAGTDASLSDRSFGGSHSGQGSGSSACSAAVNEPLPLPEANSEPRNASSLTMAENAINWVARIELNSN